VLANNLIAKESTVGGTRVHLMSRSEFVLILQRDRMLGPRMQVHKKRESKIERATFRDAINIRDQIKTLISCCGCVTRQLRYEKQCKLKIGF